MVDAKQATAAAMNFLKDMLGVLPPETGLEEIELAENDGYWHVTLGWPHADPLAALTLGRRRTEDMEYKVFKVRADNCQVVSMKIRKP